MSEPLSDPIPLSVADTGGQRTDRAQERGRGRTYSGRTGARQVAWSVQAYPKIILWPAKGEPQNGNAQELTFTKSLTSDLTVTYE